MMKYCASDILDNLNRKHNTEWQIGYEKADYIGLAMSSINTVLLLNRTTIVLVLQEVGMGFMKWVSEGCFRETSKEREKIIPN